MERRGGPGLPGRGPGRDGIAVPIADTFRSAFVHAMANATSYGNPHCTDYTLYPHSPVTYN
eukprot:2037753-Prymnesium_polylepis.1